MFKKELGYKKRYKTPLIGPLIIIILYACFLYILYTMGDTIHLYIKHIYSGLGIILTLNLVSYVIKQKRMENNFKNDLKKFIDESYVTTGKIYKYIIYVTGLGLNKKNHYFLCVTYIDPTTNQRTIHVTKEVNFHPLLELKNAKCTVHIKEDKVYVTGFTKKRILEPCMYPEQQKKMMKEIIKRIIKAVFILIMIIVCILFKFL